MIDTKNLEKFISSVAKTLELSEPVELRFRFKSNEEFDAEYWPKFNKWGGVKRHIIQFYISNEFPLERSFQTLLAHEMIHAAQAEKDIDDIHGEFFQNKAKILELEFGIMLDKIFDPELDE